MKKVIVTAAAFMMVAGVASVASATVDLSGNARARMFYTDNINISDDSESHYDSRVRVNVEAKSNGGAFAKARIRMIDGAFGMDNDPRVQTGTDNSKENIYVDYAWVGVPLTSNLTLEAGYMVASWSHYFGWDARKDRVKLTYKASKSLVMGGYMDKISENDANDFVGSTMVDDNDANLYAYFVKNTLANGTKVALLLNYVNSDVNDTDGFLGDLNVSTKVGDGTLYGEIGYKSSDSLNALKNVTTVSDDQIGVLVSWNGAMGSMKPTVMVGMAKDGFAADPEDFGWFMIGNSASAIAAAKLNSVAGDETYFGAFSNTFKMSEKTSLTGNLVYVDAVNHLVEVSASYAYAVSDGATITMSAGYLDRENSSNATAALVSLDITY